MRFKCLSRQLKCSRTRLLRPIPPPPLLGILRSDSWKIESIYAPCFSTVSNWRVGFVTFDSPACIRFFATFCPRQLRLTKFSVSNPAYTVYSKKRKKLCANFMIIYKKQRDSRFVFIKFFTPRGYDIVRSKFEQSLIIIFYWYNLYHYYFDQSTNYLKKIYQQQDAKENLNAVASYFTHTRSPDALLRYVHA